MCYDWMDLRICLPAQISVSVHIRMVSDDLHDEVIENLMNIYTNTLINMYT